MTSPSSRGGGEGWRVVLHVRRAVLLLRSHVRKKVMQKEIIVRKKGETIV
jgi:hypothetical protein